MKPDTKFKFGQWLPDQPDLDNPGVIEANNVVFTQNSYAPYMPLNPTGSVLSGTHALAAYRGFASSPTTPGYLFAGSTDGSAHGYLSYSPTGLTFSDCTPTGGISMAPDRFCFTQYGGNVIATYGNQSGGAQAPLTSIANSSSPFVALTGPYGPAPSAFYCGVVGQFVVLANLNSTLGLGSSAIQWSGINAPFDWPTPNSSQAIAEQSSAQLLDYRLGQIHGVSEGDQWAIIMCDGGIVRMTYIGGQVVFQFDNINRGPSLIGPNAWIKVGGLVYMLSPVGPFVTDGTNVKPIGEGRINRWFSSNMDMNYPLACTAGIDFFQKIIYWSFPKVGNGGIQNSFLAYNYYEDRWTHGTDAIACYVRGQESSSGMTSILGFNTSGRAGAFTGNPGVATIVTPEAEFNPGKRSIVTAVTPQVTGTTSVTVKIGHRAKQSDSVSYTSAVAPDAFTGDSNFFVDDRYHRAEIDITGSFTQATGGTFDAQPSSAF